MPTCPSTPLRCARGLILLCVGAIFAAPPAHPQDLVAKADALLRAGRMFAAESLYYAAVRHSPRNPEARLALGQYLAARGAMRVGAVLMEEARFFGAGSARVAAQLAPVYARLGDYRALAWLPASPLSHAERARAAWLCDNPPAADGPESTTIPYQPHDGKTLGSIVLQLGVDSIVATIDPHASGLTLDTSWAHRIEIQRFAPERPGDSRSVIGVARAVRLGELTLVNVPLRFASQRSTRSAIIGPDLLATFAPTVAPVTRTILLRKSGRISGGLSGQHIPTLTVHSGLWLARGGTLVPLAGPAALRLLRTGSWTIDSRRGEIVLAGP